MELPISEFVRIRMEEMQREAERARLVKRARSAQGPDVRRRRLPRLLQVRGRGRRELQAGALEAGSALEAERPVAAELSVEAELPVEAGSALEAECPVEAERAVEVEV